MLENHMVIDRREIISQCETCGGTGSYSNSRDSWEGEVLYALHKIASKDKTAKSFIDVIDIFTESDNYVEIEKAYNRASEFLRSRNINFNICPTCDGTGEIVE